MERSIKFLADQDAAAPAQKRLDKMKTLLDSLVALARTLLAELEAKLDANPHDQNELNKYIAKALRSVYRVLRSNPDQAEAGIRAIRERLAKLRKSADESRQKLIDDVERNLANSLLADVPLLAPDHDWLDGP